MAVVNKVVSDTEIKAITTKGAVVASSDYAILLSDSLTVDGLAQDVAETLRYYQSQETVIADAVDFFKTFDFESLQNLANQVKADSQSAGASATAAAASESAAKLQRPTPKHLKIRRRPRRRTLRRQKPQRRPRRPMQKRQKLRPTPRRPKRKLRRGRRKIFVIRLSTLWLAFRCRIKLLALSLGRSG